MPVRPLNIYFDGAVDEVTAKRTPARERVADGRRSVRLARETRESLVEPEMQIIHQRSRSCLADLTTQGSRLATNLTFNIVKLSDRWIDSSAMTEPWATMDLVELAPCMSPAGGFNDPAAFVEMMESNIGIGLQNTGEEAQMLLGMFSFAILRVGDPYGWSHIITRRPIVAHIGPEPRGFGLACSWSQHRNGRIIRVYLRSREHALEQLADQRRE